MAFELKQDQATLFKNEKKEKPNHPDYTGQINQNGKVRKLAAWIKESKKGTKYFSISISDAETKNDSQDLPS